LSAGRSNRSASAGRRTSRPTLRHLQPGGEQHDRRPEPPHRRSVVVWDNGKCLRDANDDIATFTVDGSGQITVTNAGASYTATVGMVGLSYTAQWKSTKLAYAAQGGSALNQRKKYDHLGVILDRTHHRGLKYGPDFNTLSPCR
jgi:hypothetical protein